MLALIRENADACVVRGRTQFNQEKAGCPGALSRQPIGSWDRNEPEAIVILSLVVSSAALQTGDVASHGADAGESRPAFAASIEEAAFETDAFQRQIMTSRFVWNAQIFAGLPPFSSMRRNLAAAGAMLRQEMGEFMTKGSLNLGR